MRFCPRSLRNRGLLGRHWQRNRRPLAARYELRLPGIEQAARKLDLDVATYFNSGVLLFNLRSKKLPELLDSAIEIAVRSEGPSKGCGGWSLTGRRFFFCLDFDRAFAFIDVLENEGGPA